MAGADGSRWAPVMAAAGGPTVMTFDTALMMKVMTVSLILGPSPAHGRREIRESLTRLSH
ncbi:MAG TPA: hypothetical protein DIT03_00430 [Candidatus Accumulibacter sp.]|nr:hypothetical protein [Accumulibacter sp.]